MKIPYIVGIGVAYTAALWLLVRRLRLPGRGYLPEKTLCSLCFVAVAAVCAALGSRPEAFWRLLPALLCCLVGDVAVSYTHLDVYKRQAYTHEPYTLKNTLQIGGKYYVCGTGRQPILRDKTVNDNYYIPVSYTHLRR